MSRVQIPIIVLDDVTGKFVQNAQVTITKRDTTAATVFQAETGGTTNAQPLLSDAQGRVSGWLDRGSYTATIVVPSRPTRTEYLESNSGGDGAIDSGWLSTSSVTNAKLGPDAVDSSKILDGSITSGDLGANSVTTAKLADSNVTTSKLADAGVTTPKIADGAITASKLNSQLVTSDRVLLRRNVPSFSVGTTQRRSFIFPYTFPSANSTYYRDYYWMAGGATQQDVTLTNVSSKVTVTIWTGGYSTRPGDVELLVFMDGVQQGHMVQNTVVHGAYTWNAWPMYSEGFNQVYASQTVTGVSPGAHTWNLKLTWSTAYPQGWVHADADESESFWQDRWGVYYDYFHNYYLSDWFWWYGNSPFKGRFVSQGVSLFEIKEEPNV